jgi:ribonuclease HII
MIYKYKKYDILVGIDEVGRGPIAGPVTLCAFGVEKKFYKDVFRELSGITDSKKLTEKKREYFFKKIKKIKKDGKVKVSLFSVSAKRIDEKGISLAIRVALKKVTSKITEKPHKAFLYLDGSLFVDEKFSQETIIKGDLKNWLIGAASVVAKVTRDKKMKENALRYPNYGFEKHKGYGTKLHYENIKKFGFCDIHRKTWVKKEKK